MREHRNSLPVARRRFRVAGTVLSLKCAGPLFKCVTPASYLTTVKILLTKRAGLAPAFLAEGQIPSRPGSNEIGEQQSSRVAVAPPLTPGMPDKPACLPH